MSGYQTVDASPISMRKWEEKLGPRSSFPSYAIRDVMDELFCFSLFMKNLTGIIVVEFRSSAFHGLYSFYENCIAKVLLSGKPGQLRSSNWTHFLCFLSSKSWFLVRRISYFPIWFTSPSKRKERKMSMKTSCQTVQSKVVPPPPLKKGIVFHI